MFFRISIQSNIIDLLDKGKLNLLEYLVALTNYCFFLIFITAHKTKNEETLFNIN